VIKGEEHFQPLFSRTVKHIRLVRGKNATLQYLERRTSLKFPILAETHSG